MPARKTKPNAIHSDRLYATFACNLKRLRQEAGLKMYAAADALGVAKSTWSQWESGQRFPNGEMLAAIAASFRVKAFELLKDDNDSEMFTCREPAMLVEVKRASIDSV